VVKVRGRYRRSRAAVTDLEWDGGTSQPLCHLARLTARICLISLLSHVWRGMEMANLLVRNLDDALVQNLREQAAAHGRSVEAEHREILAQALFQPKKLSFAELSATTPTSSAAMT
jgi:plasmid stability protein